MKEEEDNISASRTEVEHGIELVNDLGGTSVYKLGVVSSSRNSEVVVGVRSGVGSVVGSGVGKYIYLVADIVYSNMVAGVNHIRRVF